MSTTLSTKPLGQDQLQDQDPDQTYIDYEAFLSPTFSPTDFANKLILATNDPTDIPTDLTTPLSRVLFDVQEVDTHIDTLTTKAALPLLQQLKSRSEAGRRILDAVEMQVAALSEDYDILRKEVLVRYEAAEQVRLAAERLCETVRLGRVVGRLVLLGRQLEAQFMEVQGVGGRKGEHRAMVRAAHTVLAMKDVVGQEGEKKGGASMLNRVDAVRALKTDLIIPSEKLLVSKSQQTIREFSMSSLLALAPTSTTTASTTTTATQGATSNYAQTEETRSRATSALLTLYLLSPLSPTTTAKTFEPNLTITALQDYLQTALRSSVASLTRSLATLPTLDRTLIEVSARCQNIVALETLLESTKTPPHPAFSATEDSKTEADNATVPSDFLASLLQSLDTSSLPSYFWRSLASALAPRVQEIMTRAGVSARTLRSNKDRVRDALKSCVDKGSQLPPTAAFGRAKTVRNWEREAAVMVGAVVNAIGRG